MASHLVVHVLGCRASVHHGRLDSPSTRTVIHIVASSLRHPSGCEALLIAPNRYIKHTLCKLEFDPPDVFSILPPLLFLSGYKQYGQPRIIYVE